MPKQRVVTLTPEQEAIIGRGGEPGASAVVEPIRQGKTSTVQRKATSSETIDGACRPTMVRIPLEEYAELKSEIQNRSKSERVSMNSWIVAAIRQRLDRGG
jgi:hypothetical protein